MIGSSFGLQESPEINASLYVLIICMLWAWEYKIMHENSPFSSLLLISKDIVIIVVLLLILCISDAQKTSKIRELPHADSAFKHSSVHCLLVLYFAHTTSTQHCTIKRSISTAGCHQPLDCVSSWRLDLEWSQGDGVCRSPGEGLYWRKCLDRSNMRTPIVNFMQQALKAHGKTKGQHLLKQQKQILLFHSM